MSLLSAATQAPSRSASGVVARPVRGFHLLRVDGFSVTTNLPGGERISSQPFHVGGRVWYVDYYPNGTDGAKDTSDAIALYLRLHGSQHSYTKERVRADYKFSLLDHAGDAAYELPPETGIFTPAVDHVPYGGGHHHQRGEGAGNPGCGYAAFITKEELGRRREILLREDSLAIRCDVGVAEMETVLVAPKLKNRDARARRGGRGGDGSESPNDDEYDGGGRRSQAPPPSDAEYVRRCLATYQRK